MPFQEHIDLLHFFLAHRLGIVEPIQALLNAQRKPIEYLLDGSLLSRHFDNCFFSIPGVTDRQARLQRQLDDAHRAGGFAPREIPGLYNRLADPAEMMMRAFHLWRETRWPGRSGRIRYAHTLFNLSVVRSLELLSLRLWDDRPGSASDRLSHVQAVLDRLWKTAPADQPVLVKDARWLIPLAQSPATDELGTYFDIAEKIAETFAAEDRIDVHNAGVRMAGGHLRSQLRYHSTKKAVSRDEDGLIVSTRTSNALDFALLIQDLVPLLDAYEQACLGGDPKRIELADAICQGISPDPELFVNRVDLLGAYSMIEHLFIATDADGCAIHTPIGRRHVQMIEAYAARIGRAAKTLAHDCARFRPARGAYSPYGVLYGFTTNLMEHMAFKTLQADAATHFGLEDVFTAGNSDKLAWVNGWRKLPHLGPEVTALFDYPQQFAEDSFARVERALHSRASARESPAVVQTGRLFVLPGGSLQADAGASPIDDLPVHYVRSSDAQLVAAHRAESSDETELLNDRREGKCLVSYKTPDGWVAISKAMLTEVLGTGRDVKITGLPPAAQDALTLMYPDLVVQVQDS